MKIFTLIGLSIVIYGCSNINHMVDGRSRLKDLTQFGSVEQRVKSISNSLNNCPAGKMQIDYSFIDITSSHVMGQREPMPLIIGLVNDGTILSKEHWIVSCLNDSEHVEVLVTTSKVDSTLDVHFKKATKNELGDNFIPFAFIDSYDKQKIEIRSFKQLVQKYRKYLASLGYRAFAVTDNGVYGFSYEEPSLEKAKSEALRACREYKNSKSGPCRLVSIQQPGST